MNTNDNSISRYQHAVSIIKAAILKSQARAAQTITHEQLALYYGIGRYVSQNSRNGFWGTGAIAIISQQLKYEMPGLKGFSESMIKLMRTFYEEWKYLESNSLISISENMQDERNKDNSLIRISELQNNESTLEEISPLQLTGYEDFPLTAFLNISFSHHSAILRRVKSLDERKYYIQLAFDQRLKVDDLEEMMKAGVYNHREELPNNFFKAIPDKRLALQTLKILKDAYLLDFINVEDIDEMDPENVDESIIEKQIVMNIKNFIMNFGRAFTYRGHQVHYDKLGEDSWIDLLFYNRIIRSLVVIELKKGKFKPSYLGQLSAYLRILDAEEKLPDENPSVGIILCKKANKAFVEFVIQGYNNPMGVATYKTTVDQLKALLPPEEELKKLLPDDDEEL
ncbi:MAG: PDDEXK nuclease domain-containing protein [Paludibacteraceae bacterium]|nr:PDDEXK nuclease domain-containing protein [Paludibacteraceae bacterium]